MGRTRHRSRRTARKSCRPSCWGTQQPSSAIAAVVTTTAIAITQATLGPKAAYLQIWDCFCQSRIIWGVIGGTLPPIHSWERDVASIWEVCLGLLYRVGCPKIARASEGHLVVFFFLFFVFCFLGPHPWHMEVPTLGVQLELQLPAYTTGTATRDLSHVCNLHHSSRQRRNLSPLSEARGWTCNLTVPSQIRFHCATMGTSRTSCL